MFGRYPRRYYRAFIDEQRAAKRGTKSVTALQDWLTAAPMDRTISAVRARVRVALRDRREKPQNRSGRIAHPEETGVRLLRPGVERC
jgi:hypothetical protein